jgi:outer membrane lipoprotein-sorting protein
MTNKLQKNQNGIAHVLLAVLVVAVVAAIGLVAWKVNNNRSTASTAIDKVVQDKCMTEVNDKQLCKFAGAFANVTNFKVAGTSTDSTGAAATLDLAYDSKNNISMVIKQSGQESAVVVYGGVTYVKDPTDNQWFKFAVGDKNAPEALDIKKEFTKADFKNDAGQKLAYKNLGTEQCGSLKCYKYQETDPAKSTETTYLWIDTKDSLLRRVTTSDSKDKTNTDFSLTYGSVVISLPSPTKDVPAAATQ